MTAVEINGLPLPTALIRAIEEQRWVAPAAEVLERVFTEQPEQASFYSLDYMRIENRRWPEVARRSPALCGRPDASAPPGDIDPERSVLIGDLGYEMPFALDYRESFSEPRIVYALLRTGRWIAVAPRIEDLLNALGLQG